MYVCITYLVAQMVKNLPAMQEAWVLSLGWEDPLEKGIATHSSILVWRIPWTEKPSGLQSMGCHKESDTTEQLTQLSNTHTHHHHHHHLSINWISIFRQKCVSFLFSFSLLWRGHVKLWCNLHLSTFRRWRMFLKWHTCVLIFVEPVNPFWNCLLLGFLHQR